MKFFELSLKKVREGLFNGFRANLEITKLWKKNLKSVYLTILGKHFFWVAQGEEILNDFTEWVSFRKEKAKGLPDFKMEIRDHVVLENYHHFHLSRRVTRCQKLTFDSMDSQPTKQSPLVRELLRIHGAAVICIEPYEITIRKAQVFDWGEIDPEAERVIRKYLKYNDIADYTSPCSFT